MSEKIEIPVECESATAVTARGGKVSIAHDDSGYRFSVELGVGAESGVSITLDACFHALESSAAHILSLQD